MQNAPLGSLENPIRSQRTAINTISVRNNCLVQCYNNSEIVGNRIGTVSTLKQNLTSEYLQRTKNLKQIETFYDVVEHTRNIEEQYDNHKREVYLQSLSKIAESIQTKSFKIPVPIELKELGTMSKNQIKSVRRCLENMASMVLMGYKKSVPKTEQQYLTFLTLTLPSKQVHCDKTIRKLQTRFIEILQKSYKVVHYVWKAETQANGSYHSHILLDRYIDKDIARSLWNKTIEKKGYITEYQKKRKKEGFVYKPTYLKNGKICQSKLSKEEQYNSYLKSKKENFLNPNTTDIHSIKGLGNSISYFMKYMTKPEPNKRPIIGAVWGASNLTKKLTYPKFYESENAFNLLQQLIKSERLNCVIKDEYFSVYSGEIYRIISKEYRHTIWKQMKEHYKTLRAFTKKVQNKLNQELRLKEIAKKINQKIFEISKPILQTIKEPPKIKPFQYTIYGDLSPVVKF